MVSRRSAGFAPPRDLGGFLARSIKRPIGSPGNHFKIQIMVFETQVKGIVQTLLHPNSIAGPHAIRLFLEELKEFVLATKREIVGHHARGSDRQYFLKPV